MTPNLQLNKSQWYKYWFVLGNDFQTHFATTAPTENTQLTKNGYIWELCVWWGWILPHPLPWSQDKHSHIKDLKVKKTSMGVEQFNSDKTHYLCASCGLFCLKTFLGILQLGVHFCTLTINSTSCGSLKKSNRYTVIFPNWLLGGLRGAQEPLLLTLINFSEAQSLFYTLQSLTHVWVHLKSLGWKGTIFLSELGGNKIYIYKKLYEDKRRRLSNHQNNLWSFTFFFCASKANPQVADRLFWSTQYVTGAAGVSWDEAEKWLWCYCGSTGTV